MTIRNYNVYPFKDYYISDDCKVYRQVDGVLVGVSPVADKLYEFHKNGKSVAIPLASVATLAIYGYVDPRYIPSSMSRWDRVTYSSLIVNNVTHIDENTISINQSILFKKHPKYQMIYVSDHGLVYSMKSDFIIKPLFDKDGYRKIFIPAVDGKGNDKRSVHRLVYEAWTGKMIPDEMVIHHKDSCKINNHISNLECVTTQKNLRYSVINGERNLDRIYLESDIRKMCQMMQDGKGAQDVAIAFGISPTSKEYTPFRNRLSGIRNGYYWKDISAEYDFSNYGGKPKRIKHPTETIHAICRLIDGGASNTDIIKAVEHEGTDKNFFNIISNIRNKTKYQEISKNYEFNKDYQHNGSTRQTTRYGEAEIENIVKRRDNGESVKSIAREMGVGYTHLIQLVKRYDARNNKTT